MPDAAPGPEPAPDPLAVLEGLAAEFRGTLDRLRDLADLLAAVLRETGHETVTADQLYRLLLVPAPRGAGESP